LQHDEHWSQVISQFSPFCLGLQTCDRILFLQATVNMFRLLRLLARRTPDHSLPVCMQYDRPYGTSITIGDVSVVKRIKDFASQSNITIDFADLCQVSCRQQRVWLGTLGQQCGQGQQMNREACV
jgi:hypothetical protein